MQLIKIFYKENVPILNDFWYKNLYAGFQQFGADKHATPD